MKVEIKHNTVIKEQLPFPKLMIAKNNDLVLFIEPEIGVLLNNHQRYSKCWNINNFEDFDGEVTLKNK